MFHLTTTKRTVRQMFGHSKVYTVSQWHEDNHALPQRLFAAVTFNVGSMFMFEPQSVRMGAYLCGSVLFEFSLSGMKY